MKYIYLALFIIFVFVFFFAVSRYWSAKSGQNDVADLNSLKQQADSGASIRQLLLKANETGYVLNKVTAISPNDLKMKPDSDLAWDTVTSLTEGVVSEVSRIENGEIELRRRAGGYFLKLKIKDGKILSSEQTLPPSEH